MIDPTSLRVLIAVHDSGSVTQAARLLGYTAPNLTQHLRKLERALGVRVVERAGRGIVLTPEGIAAVEHGRGVVDGLDQLRLAARVAAEPAGRFRLSAFPTALRGVVLPAMVAARSAHPELEIVPTELEPEPAFDLMGTGRLDAVLDTSFGPGGAGRAHTPHLVRVPVGIDPLDVLLPRGHPLARRRRLRLHDLAAERLAVTPREDPYGAWVASHGSELIEPVNRAYQAVELQSLVRYVELGLAVTVVPRMGRPALPETVVTVPLADADAYRAIELCVPPVAARSRTVAAVVELLRGGLADV